MKTLLLSIVAAALLAACGGGGGGSTPAPPVAPTPVDARITIDGLTPAVGATTVAVDSAVTVRYSVTGTLESVIRSSPVCGTVPATGTQSTTSPGVTVFTASAPAPDGVVCKGSVTIVASGTNGGRPATATTEYSYTTMPAPAAWYASVAILPAEVTHPGVTAEVNKLPAGCTSQAQSCWRDTLVAGIIKPIQSGLIYNGRRIIFVPFFRPEGNYNVSALYADDFSPADDGTIIGGATGGGGPAWYRGVSGGLLVPVSILPGFCFTYGPSVTGAWTYGLAVRCPAT